MTLSHRSLQHDYEVSCPELDFLVDTALKVGQTDYYSTTSSMLSLLYQPYMLLLCIRCPEYMAVA